jgi:F-type H+-transporting ATPase subunit a
MSTTETLQEITAETHTWPHIPALQWEIIPGWDFSLFWMEFHISNTVFSTWIFMVFFFVMLYLFKRALNKDSSLLKSTWILIVKTLEKFSIDFTDNKSFSQKILFLTWGLFIFIFLANVFWLFLDWILLIASPNLHLTEYLRPINSDPNTTFAMSISIVLITHIVMVKSRGTFGYLKGYIFNFSGKWFEKLVNVFLWWLHLVSEFVKALSLSLRLFGNILAWVILIGILAFLWWMINIAWIGVWEVFVLPFWFFELFVALIQAAVFFVLSSIYFKQAIEHEH